MIQCGQLTLSTLTWPNWLQQFERFARGLSVYPNIKTWLISLVSVFKGLPAVHVMGDGRCSRPARDGRLSHICFRAGCVNTLSAKRGTQTSCRGGALQTHKAESVRRSALCGPFVCATVSPGGRYILGHFWKGVFRSTRVIIYCYSVKF